MDNYKSKVTLQMPEGSLILEGTEAFVKSSAELILDGNKPTSESDLLLKEGLDHAWEWFSLHANQRMQAVNFFLVAAAFLTAGYASAMQYSSPGLGAVVSIVGVCFSVFFGLLEKRIQELVKAGERALLPAQRLIAQKTGVEALKICDNVEIPKDPQARYSTVIRGLHRVTMTAFGLQFLYALFRIVQAKAAFFSNDVLLRSLSESVLPICAVVSCYLAKTLVSGNLSSNRPAKIVLACILAGSGAAVLVVLAYRR